MKKALLLLFLVLLVTITSFTEAAVKVKWYYRKDGTYVKPYVRSNPDWILSNNYSYLDNPYTSSNQEYIQWYFKKNGTYVSWYRRTKANNTVTDNRSYEWNNILFT